MRAYLFVFKRLQKKCGSNSLIASRCPKEYLFEGSQVPPAFASVKRSVKTNTSMVNCSNDADSKNSKLSFGWLGVILSTKSLTWTVQRSNPGLRDLTLKINLNCIYLLLSTQVIGEI
jgi:hypothetical protein